MAIKHLDDLILESNYNVSRKHFLMDCVSYLIGKSAKLDKYTTLYEDSKILILKK